MDVATLLTGTKWNIIELLAKKAFSPSDLALKLNTTIANISQQLRLLETAGFVTKKRTGTAKPGKPRVLFSLSDDYCMIMLFTKGFARKKLVKISKEQIQQLVVQSILKQVGREEEFLNCDIDLTPKDFGLDVLDFIFTCTICYIF